MSQPHPAEPSDQNGSQTATCPPCDQVLASIEQDTTKKNGTPVGERYGHSGRVRASGAVGERFIESVLPQSPAVYRSSLFDYLRKLVSTHARSDPPPALV